MVETQGGRQGCNDNTKRQSKQQEGSSVIQTLSEEAPAKAYRKISVRHEKTGRWNDKIQGTLRKEIVREQ